MSSNRLFLIVVSLVVFAGAVVHAAEQLTDEQKARLAEIEEYIEARKQGVEDRCAERLGALNSERRCRMRPMTTGVTLKTVRGGFSGWASYLEEFLRLEGIDLRRDEDYLHTLEEFRGGSMIAIEKLNQAPKLLAIAERRLADERSCRSRSIELEKVQIEKEKRYAVEVELPQLEEKLKDKVLNPSEPAPDGKVMGIVYSQDRPAAIVGSKIVHEGEQINGVSIVAIFPDSVEFKSGDERWSQKFGDEPSDNW